MEIPRLITILGPTAVGKTRLAALLAEETGGEILSADSRQVYRGMTIGTGKDLEEYVVNGNPVPYHIIDVAHPNEEFHVFRFKKMFMNVVQDLLSRNRQPILCGGTGLYLDAVLRDYFFVDVPENVELRQKLSGKSIEELSKLLLSVKKVHNKTDLEDRKRLVRAIEIHEHHRQFDSNIEQLKICDSRVFGIMLPREQIRTRIADRLNERILGGMIDEVETLIQEGVTYERLLSFGLEYKYVTLFLKGKLSMDEMLSKLCTSIQQFAKRQMSWFRRMERLGVSIEWIDGTLSQEERKNAILQKL